MKSPTVHTVAIVSVVVGFLVQVACSDDEPTAPPLESKPSVEMCDDGNPCTADTVEPDHCYHVQVEEGQPCLDGNGTCDETGVCRP